MSRKLHVGIDVANTSLVVSFLDQDERTVRPFAEYSNDPKGWLALKADIISGATLCGKRTRIVCGMESTGNMHKRLEQALRNEKRRKLEVHVLNPKAVKHFAKAMLKDAKTDRIDSVLIARFLIRMKPEPVDIPLTDVEELKELTRIRRKMIEERTTEKNRVHKMLRYYFPGYKSHLGKQLTKRILLAFSKMPSPSAILEHSIEDIAGITNGARHRFGLSFAKSLHALAKQAPALELRRATRRMFEITTNRIIELDRLISELDVSIEEVLGDVFPDQMLTSIPGVGKVSAAAILAEVGTISRFKTKTAFVGYCGLYPIVWESGEAKRKYRMTRKGNRMLKMTLLIASAAARQYNPVVADHYNRLRSRGKTTKASGGAIARKLAEIVFTLLVTGESWSAEKATRGLEKSKLMTEKKTP
jgi:transposase